MANIENTYVGDGSTVLYSFTFPYINEADVRVSIDDVDVSNPTEYSLANATQIEFVTAPTNGAVIRIYRVTSTEDLASVFFPGSAIRARDLNDNFVQTLYIAQESSGDADAAVAAADAATAASIAAQNDATSAIATADAAAAQAATAASDASAALSAAQTAETNSVDAVADSSAALVTSQQALDLVASALPTTTVANVAAIPGSPANYDLVEVLDSTGIESFTPLAGLPNGFVGSSALRVKIVYTTAGATWNYQSYLANDPESRYELADATILKSADIGVTVQAYDAALPAGNTILVDGDVGVAVQAYDADLPAGNTILVDGDVGVTVQGYDADTAKLDGINTWTAAQTFSAAVIANAALTVNAATTLDGAVIINEAGADVDTRIEGDTATHLVFADASADKVGINQSAPAGTLDLSGNYCANITAVGALDIACSSGNYFTKTISGDSTFTFSSPPASRSYGFVLELTHTSGVVTWPAAVKWPDDTAPSLTTGKVHLFTFVTDDGGTTWRGASQLDYAS